MKNIFFTVLLINISLVAFGQTDEKQKKIIAESEEAEKVFLEKDPSLETLFNTSYGYVIFPSVAKAAAGIGGALGKGVVYENKKRIGTANLYQLSVGSQAGGQVYREIIFFENKKTLDRFKDNKVEFSAQVSAVAAASGVAAVASYVEGVAIYTIAKGGLMYEASVGGQKFQFSPF